MFKVHCQLLTKTHMTYLCPYCTSYKLKNGKERMQPKLVYHSHGNDCGFNNRVEHRGSHCPNFTGNVCIYINDATVKER